MSKFAQIVADALALSVRNHPAFRPSRRIGPDDAEEISAAWAAEAERRIDALERGEVTASDIDRIVAAVRERLRNSAGPG